MRRFKRIMALIAMLGILMPGQALVSGKAFAGNQVNVHMAGYPVTFDGIVIDNAHSRYPLLTYKDITYLPMTWDYGQALGLKTNWTQEDGLSIWLMQGDKSPLNQDLTVTNDLGKTYSAEIASLPVKVNGIAIDQQQEEYPLLTFRDITYFPMTWRFAHDQFHWGYNWDDTAGFSIVTLQLKMISRIFGDDESNLFVQSDRGVVKVNKSLLQQPTKAIDAEAEPYLSSWRNNAAAKLGAAALQGSNSSTVTKLEGNSVKWGDQELISLAPYKESDANYYAEHPEYAKSNTGVHYFEQVMKVNEQTTLLVLTVFHMTHIPAPYTPHDYIVFVKNGDLITKVEHNNQFPNYIITNADGSFWLYTEKPAVFTTRSGNVRGTLTLVQPTGQSRSMNQTLDASDIDVLLNTDGTLAIHAYNDRFGADSKSSDGYYSADYSLTVKKLFNGGSGEAYVDRTGDIYVVDRLENRITNISKNITGFWWDRDFQSIGTESE